MQSPDSVSKTTILSRSLLIILAGLLFGALSSPAHAQSIRPGDTFYSKLGGGISDYTGDFPPQNVGHPFDLQEFVRGSGLPFMVAGELGYQFSPRWALALGFQGGNYPIAGYQGGPSGISDSYRYTPQLLGRYTFSGGVVAPYIDLGVNATFGGDRPPTSVGVGPSVGGGVDILLSRAVSFYVESRFNLTFPDDAVDGASTNGRFDLTNQLLGIGLKINFTTPNPPQIFRLDGPALVETGTSVTFAARVNEEEADRPLDFQWDFGNEGTGTGLTATHAFEQPGTYEVSFSASNEVGTASQSISVKVKRPPQPAQITSVTVVPNPVGVRDSVQFLSAAGGSGPLTYEWSFGDGSSATGSSPIHTYTIPGEYTARLRVSNEAGTDTQTVSLRVVRPAKSEEVKKQAGQDEGTRGQIEKQPDQIQADQDQQKRWGIVVASTQAENSAETSVQQYRDRLQSVFMPVRIVEAETNHGPRHRVVVGEFEDKEAARQAIKEYEEDLPPMEWLLRLE